MVAAARAAAAKSGARTLVLDVSEVLSITGWFVITSGANARQVKTIAEEILSNAVIEDVVGIEVADEAAGEASSEASSGAAR